MATSTAKKKSRRRDATPQIMNFLSIGGDVFSLGDLRKADFSSLEDPKASVKSLVAWAKELNRILKGIEPPDDGEVLASAAGITPTANTTFTDIVTALNSQGASISLTTGTIDDALHAV